MLTHINGEGRKPILFYHGMVAVRQGVAEKRPSVALYRMKFRSREANLRRLLLRDGVYFLQGHKDVYSPQSGH